MATEEFKEITETLFDNYVKLKKEKMQSYPSVSLSFKEYLEFYIEYLKNTDDVSFEDDEDDYDLDDEELELESEKD